MKKNKTRNKICNSIGNFGTFMKIIKIQSSNPQFGGLYGQSKSDLNNFQSYIYEYN